MEYQKSSHISSWIFKKSEIDELRSRGNNRARRILKEEHKNKELREKEEGSVGTDGAAETSSSSSSNPSILVELPVSFAKGYSNRMKEDESYEFIEETEDLPFLTPAEETTLVNFYATKLFSLIGPNAQHPPLRRDIKVASTAALLMRRFFLSNSVMKYDPKVFMVASAFLATKVEDATVNVRYLEEGTKMMKSHVTIPEIIKAEIHLAAGIDYDLICLHPYKTVEGYTEDLRTFLKTKDGQMCVNREWVGSADLRPLYEQAKVIVQELVVTDIPLIASAGKIGIVSLLLANDELIKKQKLQPETAQLVKSGTNDSNENGIEIGEKKEEAIKIDFMGYLKLRFKDTHEESQIEQISKEIDQICETIKQSNMRNSEIDLVALKKIHKKLKKCRNLESGSSSLDEGKKKKKKKKRKRAE